MEINMQVARLKVKSITPVQNEDVYDITVRKNHNFFADGILVHNCVEVGMRAYTEDGESGFQFCNLTEINGSKATSREAFLEMCKAGAIMGTLQAGYTNFKYLSQATKDITEREALIGVGITGWMNNPDVLFDEQNMRDGATMVRDINKKMAKMLGIRPAARCTVVKPAGTTSILLSRDSSCASGIHSEHSPLYIRNVQMNTQDAVTQLISKLNPSMVEKSVYSPNDVVVSFPIETNPDSLFKKDLMGVRQLEYVKKAQMNWIEYGTNVELCVDPTLRHNVSNTISVDDWDEIEEYIYQNRAHFAGISLLSSYGDRGYTQAPFTEVFTAEQIFETYGTGALFASGLIVDAAHAFNGNLWRACDTALGIGEVLDGDESETLLKRDWVRRAIKFADNYFGGDMVKMTFCLKDCHNRHKWDNIQRVMKPIDFRNQLGKQEYVDVDTMAGAGCSAGTCEANF